MVARADGLFGLSTMIACVCVCVFVYSSKVYVYVRFGGFGVGEILYLQMQSMTRDPFGMIRWVSRDAVCGRGLKRVAR